MTPLETVRAALRSDHDQLTQVGLGRLVPVGADKRPYGKWRHFVLSEPPTHDDRDRWIHDTRTKGWAWLCGDRTGFTLDVEAAGMKHSAITTALDLLPEECKRRSPGGGVHAYILCDGGAPTGPLARDGNKVLLAEVRGHSGERDNAGAYAVVTGPGRPELDGFRPHSLSADDVEHLLSKVRQAHTEPSARKVERVRATTTRTTSSSGGGTGSLIGDAVAAGSIDWLDLLDDGWEVTSVVAGRTGLLRPDYGSPTDAAESANAVGGSFVCWSSSVPWADVGVSMGPASVLAAARFAGDYAAAMRAVESAALGRDGLPHWMASWPPDLIARIAEQAKGRHSPDGQESPEDPDDPTTEKGARVGAEDAAAPGLLPDRGPWEPVDLAAVKDNPPPTPMIGTPEGGNRGLLYPCRRHMMFGDTNCGKSWAALKCAEDTARRGLRVLWIDMEDSAAAFSDRLKTIAKHAGYDLDRFQRSFDFIDQPDEPANETILRGLIEPGRRIGLVVIDGTTDYYRLHGLDVDSNDDAAIFGAHLSLLTTTGAAVLALDASAKPHGNDAPSLYPIGGQHKLSLVNGSAYRVDTIDAFSRTTAGYSMLVLAKDRPGGVPGTRGQRVAQLSYSPEAGFRLNATVKGWADP